MDVGSLGSDPIDGMVISPEPPEERFRMSSKREPAALVYSERCFVKRNLEESGNRAGSLIPVVSI